MVEVEGLEGLLQIEGGGGEDNDAEHGVVIQTVPGAVASISDPEAKILRCLTLSCCKNTGDKPAVQRVCYGADDPDHEPEVGGV